MLTSSNPPLAHRFPLHRPALDLNLDQQDQAPAGLPHTIGKAGEGAGVGSAIGGAFGTVAAIGVATGSSFVVPGLGLVLAGPLAAAIAGAGVGAAVGGAFGALVGWISPEELL